MIISARRWRYQLILVLAVALAVPLLASYDLSWYTVDGGGGTSTGGDFELSGTVGQHDASTTMTGGSFELTGGFWTVAGSTPNPCPFDLDDNGAVGPGDVGLVKNNFGCDVNQPNCAALDFDSNGAVGPGDVGQVKNNFGPCP